MTELTLQVPVNPQAGTPASELVETLIDRVESDPLADYLCVTEAEERNLIDCLVKSMGVPIPPVRVTGFMGRKLKVI